MVQRNSEATPVPVAQEPRITAQALGQVAARSAAGAFSTHVATAEVAPVGTLLQQDNTLLSNALGKLSDSLGQIAEAERRRAYVDGSVAAVVGQSREAIEASPLTRAWVNAGFNDTKGNLALADYEAQALRDMSRLREQGPEAMQQHILKNRNSVVPALESMSTEAKIKAYESLATTDASLINKHYVEHSKFITEQKVKGIETLLNVALSAIEGSQGDPSYEASLESAYTTLVSTVLTAEDLPQEVKDSMVTDFLTAAMAQGDLGMYEYARARPLIDDGQGGTLALTRLLSMDAQVKLANEYDKYQRRWAFINDQDWHARDLEFRLAMQNGEYVPIDEYAAHLMGGVNGRAVTNEQATSRMLAYAKQSKENHDAMALAEAWLGGDLSVLAQSGKSEYELAKLMEQKLLPQGSAGQRFMLQVDKGLQNGYNGSLKRAGELLQPVISSLRTADQDAEIHPSQLELLQYIEQVSTQAQAQGYANFRSNLMALMSTDDKIFFNNVMSRIMSGESDIPTAINIARNEYHEWSNLSNAAKSNLMAGNQELANKAIKDILGEDVDFWELDQWAGKALGALGIGTGASLNAPFRAKGWGFGGHNDTANSEYRSKAAVLMHNISSDLINRGALIGKSESEVKTLIRSEAIKHIVPVKYGSSTTNLVLPYGSDLRAVFGLDEQLSSYGPDQIGQALGYLVEEYRPKDGNIHPVLTVRDGLVQASYYAAEGAYPVLTQQFGVGDISSKMQEIRKRGSAKEVEVFGTGKTVRGANKAAVTFNGENTANVSPEVMFRIRESLVKYEGVTNKAYPDGGGGKQSVGVGINTGLEVYYPPVQEDGTVTNSDISKSFKEASDYFVSKVKSYDAKWGGALKDDPNGTGLEFLTHLLYQTGERDVWFKHGPTLIEAMASKPVRGEGYMQAYQEALKAFRKFGASKTATSGNRVKFYEDLLFKYFKGY